MSPSDGELGTDPRGVERKGLQWGCLAGARPVMLLGKEISKPEGVQRRAEKQR